MNLLNIDNIQTDNQNQKPWRHWIVDDILNYDFTNIDFIKNENFYYQLLEEFDYHYPTILKKFKPNYYDLDLSKIKTSIRLGLSDAEVQRPIHNDYPSKIWSMVVYISPKKSDGTILYNRVRRLHSEVIWKQNRGLIFSPKDIVGEVTPHQIVNRQKKPRITFLFNLIDTSEVEKDNMIIADQDIPTDGYKNIINRTFNEELLHYNNIKESKINLDNLTEFIK